MNFSVFETRYLGQSVTTWAVACGLILIFAAVLSYLRAWAERHIRTRTLSADVGGGRSRLGDLLISLISGIQPLTILLISAYLATAVLDIPPRLEKLLDRAIMLMLLIQVAVWGNKLVTYWLDTILPQRLPNERSAMVGILGFASRLVLGIVLVLIGLNNFGIDITALIAGFGIGGIAVALAVQNILGDLFASLTIALDKPFEIGDAIRVDAEAGKVEHVGLKTTRVRSDTGEQVIFSNTDLLKSRIHNFKRLNERRTLLKFNVAYSATPEQVSRIPDLVKAIVRAHEPAIRFDHVNLIALGDSGLTYELVYIVLDSNYALFLKTQEEVLNKIYALFSRENIAFAQPFLPPRLS